MSEPKHVTMPRAPRCAHGVSEVFKPYRSALPQSKNKESPAAPVPYELEPELRAWLRTQVQILSYWDSLPDSHFVPLMPPATRARDAIVLSGLRRLLA